MNNLRTHNGRVPVGTNDPDHPIRLVDFPTQAEFNQLYGNRVTGESLGRYYAMLSARAAGATLTAVAHDYGITKERVRQIEAKFLRMMTKKANASETLKP
jgi:hypothetical protein